MIRAYWLWNMCAGWVLFKILPKGYMPFWALPYMGFYAYDTGYAEYRERLLYQRGEQP